MPYLLCYYCGNVRCYNHNILPLTFVRSGYVYLDYGNVGNIRGAYSWARTAVSSTLAWYLYTDPTVIHPSNGNMRNDGFPLRCLYPGSA